MSTAKLGLAHAMFRHVRESHANIYGGASLPSGVIIMGDRVWKAPAVPAAYDGDHWPTWGLSSWQPRVGIWYPGNIPRLANGSYVVLPLE